MLSRTRRHLACQLLALVASAATADAAPAPDDGTAHGDYMGAFWGFELRGGATFRSTDAPVRVIPDVGLGVRVATVVSLIDFELGVETFGLERRGYDLRRTSIAGDLRLHPLFIRYLQGTFGALVLASIHLSLGLGLETLATDGPDQDATHFAPGFRWGLGVEAPLTDPAHAGVSLWIGLGYRMTFAGFGDAPRGVRDMDQHAAWLSLSLRFHDIDFLRLPRPPELRDDD